MTTANSQFWLARYRWVGIYPDIIDMQYNRQSRHPRHYTHDDIIKWKHFPRYWPFVRGIHRSPVNSPHKGQWHGALMFIWSSPWINGWVNNCEAGDLRRYRAHCDVIVMCDTSRRPIDSNVEIQPSIVVSITFYVRLKILLVFWICRNICKRVLITWLAEHCFSSVHCTECIVQIQCTLEGRHLRSPPRF